MWDIESDEDCYINDIITPYLKEVLADDAHHFNNNNRAKENARIMRETVESLLDNMRDECLLFDHMFQKIIFTGSYYEKLRVTNPTEFDIDFVLHLPVNTEDVILLVDNNYPEFLGLQISDYHIRRRMSFYQECKALEPHPATLFTHDGHLSRCFMQQWIERVLDVAIEEVTLPDEVNEVRYVNLHGPAFTLKIFTDDDTISVDISAVLDGSNLPFPSQIKKTPRFRRMNPEAQNFVLVPKSLHGRSDECDQHSDLWRISFPEAEKKLLLKKGNVKSVIKLVKILRNRYRWRTRIYSFLLNAVFIDLLRVYPHANQWPKEHLGLWFMQSLRRIRNLFSQPQPFLEHYFIRTNVLNHPKGAKLRQFSNFVGNIIDKIESDPHNIVQVFNL